MANESLQQFTQFLDTLETNPQTRGNPFIRTPVKNAINAKITNPDVFYNKEAFAFALNQLVLNTNTKYPVTNTNWKEFKTIFLFCKKNPDIFEDITIEESAKFPELKFLYQGKEPTKSSKSSIQTTSRHTTSRHTTSHSPSSHSRSSTRNSTVSMLNKSAACLSIKDTDLTDFEQLLHNVKFKTVFLKIVKDQNYIFNTKTRFILDILVEFKKSGISDDIIQKYNRLIDHHINCCRFPDAVLYLQIINNDIDPRKYYTEMNPLGLINQIQINPKEKQGEQIINPDAEKIKKVGGGKLYKLKNTKTKVRVSKRSKSQKSSLSKNINRSRKTRHNKHKM